MVTGVVGDTRDGAGGSKEIATGVIFVCEADLQVLMLSVLSSMAMLKIVTE